MRSAVLALLLLVAPQQAAAAIPPPVVGAHPIFANGRLEGCEVVFDIAQPDHIYNRSRSRMLSGSVSLRLTDGQVSGVMLKLGTLAEGEDAQVAPTRALLRQGFRTSIDELQAQFDGELAGYRLFVYRLGPVTTQAIGLAASEGLHLTYAMPAGAADAQFDVLPDPLWTTPWGDCVEELLRVKQ